MAGSGESGEKTSSGRLPFSVLFGYGLLGAPLSAMLLPLYINVPTVYAAELGVGFAAVGAVLLGVRLFDMASDPLIGWLSDRTRLPLGRRRPWMILGTFPLVLAAIMLFMPPDDPGTTYLALWAAILTLGATMVTLPHVALGAELSPDYHERSRVTGLREILSAIGALILLGTPAALALDGRGALAAMGFMIAVATPIAVFILIKTVRELPPPTAPRLGFSKRLAAIRANGPFQRLIAAYLLNGIANGLPATLFLVFVEHRLGLPGAAGPLLFLYFLSGIAGVPIWVYLSRTLGKHRAWLAAMIVAALIFAFVPLLGPGDLIPFAIITVLTGLCLGGDLALPPSMQADVVDIDTAMTRQRPAGIYFALWNVSTKLALALAVGLSFPLLGLLGFDEPETVGEGGLLSLALLYSLVPAALKLGAAAIIWGYRFDAAALASVRTRIEAGSGN